MSARSNIPLLMECVRHFSDPAAGEKYLQLYDPLIVLHGYGLQPSIDAIRAHYGRLWSAFPNVTLTIDDILESADRMANDLSNSLERSTFGRKEEGRGRRSVRCHVFTGTLTSTRDWR